MMLHCVRLLLTTGTASWNRLSRTSFILACGIAVVVAHDATALTLQTAAFFLATGNKYEHSSGDWEIELVSNVTDMADLASVSGTNENQSFYFRSLAYADGEWEITKAALVAYSGTSSGETTFFNNFGAISSYKLGGTAVHTAAASINSLWYPDEGASRFDQVNEPVTGDTIVTVTFPLNQYKFVNFDFAITSFTINLQPIPEPSTALLFGIGLVGLGMRRRKVLGQRLVRTSVVGLGAAKCLTERSPTKRI